VLKSVRVENENLRTENLHLKNSIAKLNIKIAKLETRILIPDPPFPNKNVPKNDFENSRRWSQRPLSFDNIA
jgi:hypothetical protein